MRALKIRWVLLRIIMSSPRLWASLKTITTRTLEVEQGAVCLWHHSNLAKKRRTHGFRWSTQATNQPIRFCSKRPNSLRNHSTYSLCNLNSSILIIYQPSVLTHHKWRSCSTNSCLRNLAAIHRLCASHYLLSHRLGLVLAVLQLIPHWLRLKFCNRHANCSLMRSSIRFFCSQFRLSHSLRLYLRSLLSNSSSQRLQSEAIHRLP